MNKIKKIAVAILLLLSVTLFSACSVKEMMDFVYYGTFFPDLVSAPVELNENQTLQRIMNARDLIRTFNVYIETNLSNSVIDPNAVTNMGSGIIVAKNEATKTYYVLTNNHVINYGNYLYHSYTLETISGKSYTATLMLRDTINDMAILKFVSSETLGIANISNRTGIDLLANEFLLAVGNPNGVKHNVTYGKFLGLADIANVNFRVIHHSALIKPGNSGGALTDINGNLVGINTWGTENKDTDNYAIPLSKVKTFLQTAQSQLSGFPTIVKG